MTCRAQYLKFTCEGRANTDRERSRVMCVKHRGVLIFKITRFARVGAKLLAVQTLCVSHEPRITLSLLL